MNDKTTKTQVRSDFKHARYLMRVAEQVMTAQTPYNAEYQQMIANELMASVATFTQWVEDQQAATDSKGALA